LLTPAETEDAPNEAFTTASGRIYGQLDFLPDVDYSDGKMERKSLFTVFPPGYMQITNGSTGVLIGPSGLRHHFVMSNDAEPKTVKCPWLLLYNNGKRNIDPSEYYYFQSGRVAGVPTFMQLTYYGQYSMVQDYLATENTYALTFSEESCFDVPVPQNTITNTLWLDWLTQLYKRSAYTLEVSFPIDIGFYLKLADASIIVFGGFYHIVVNWTYNTADGMIKLKLMRYDSIDPAIEEKADADGRKIFHAELDGTLKIKDY